MCAAGVNAFAREREGEEGEDMSFKYSRKKTGGTYNTSKGRGEVGGVGSDRVQLAVVLVGCQRVGGDGAVGVDLARLVQERLEELRVGPLVAVGDAIGRGEVTTSDGSI